MKRIADILFVVIAFTACKDKTKFTVDGKFQNPVSYTHLDVYKRQDQCFRRFGWHGDHRWRATTGFVRQYPVRRERRRGRRYQRHG